MQIRKTILIISAVFPPEQVTSALLNYDLAKELSKTYKVIVLRPKPTRPIGAKFDDTPWKDSNFETIQINSYTNPKSEILGRFREAIDFSKKCCKYIKAHHKGIDFIYNDGWQLFGLYLIAKTCVKYQIPYIVPIQDIYPESLFTGRKIPSKITKLIQPLLMYFDKYYQRNAFRVRTISSEMADYLSNTRAVNREKYLTINNWQNDEDYECVSQFRKSQNLIFAYVGSINSHANVELIIKAFHKANLHNAELHIYGGGNQKEYCINLVDAIDAKNIFFDYVTRKDVPKIQASADVLVLALPKGNGSLCLPSKLTSYLLSGKPVIASVDNDSATSRIIKNEKCGFITSPDDLNTLSQTFIHFSKISDSEIIQMSQNSRNYALKHLSRESNLTKLITVIHNLLNNG